jgi:nitroreductase
MGHHRRNRPPQETILLDLFETMRTNRAMRRLKPDPVPEDLVRRVLEAATYAPSGSNRQPWRFIVITDPELKARMGEFYRAGGAAHRAAAPGEAQPGRLPDQRPSPGEYLAEHMAEVPVLILVCFYPGTAGGHFAGAHIYPAVQNLLLAARALGLGATLTTIHHHHDPDVKRLLGIPDEVETAALIPLGFPMGRFGPVDRRPVEEVAFAERWGNPI